MRKINDAVLFCAALFILFINFYLSIMDVSLNGLSKEMRKNLIEEIRQLEQDIKTSEFISPKKMRDLRKKKSLLITDGKNEDLTFKISKNSDYRKGLNTKKGYSRFGKVQ
jgi:hypothetical protein